MLPKKAVLPTLSASRFIFFKASPLGANPFVLVYSSIKFSLNSLDVCKASNDASPADELIATAVLLAVSPNFANCVVCFCIACLDRLANAEDLVDRSAMDEI